MNPVYRRLKMGEHGFEQSQLETEQLRKGYLQLSLAALSLSALGTACAVEFLASPTNHRALGLPTMEERIERGVSRAVARDTEGMTDPVEQQIYASRARSINRGRLSSVLPRYDRIIAARKVEAARPGTS